MSPFGTLGKRDFINGLVVSVVSAVLTVLVSLFSQGGFNIFTADWAGIVNNVVVVSFIAMSSYLMKNLSTNSSGELFKKE